MANLITVARLGLLFAVIAAIYFGGVRVITLCMPIVAFIFAADGFDGYVARRRRSASQFGAVFDIAGDRIVENAFWIVFAELDLIPVWVPLLVMTRGFIVDGVRAISYAEGKTAFGKDNMMRSDFTRWLTGGRLMRGLYGYAKALGFVFLVGLEGYRHHDAGGTFLGGLYANDAYRAIGWTCVWGALVLTVIRGLPVIYDASSLWTKPDPAPDHVSKSQ
ncbi:MAG: CDP-alcohol phosphatidyltransferase family protein [Thermomicrobiales bacterium]